MITSTVEKSIDLDDIADAIDSLKSCLQDADHQQDLFDLGEISDWELKAAEQQREIKIKQAIVSLALDSGVYQEAISKACGGCTYRKLVLPNL